MIQEPLGAQMWGCGTYFLWGQGSHDIIHGAREHASSRKVWVLLVTWQGKDLLCVAWIYDGFPGKEASIFYASGFFGEGWVLLAVCSSSRSRDGMRDAPRGYLLSILLRWTSYTCGVCWLVWLGWSFFTPIQIAIWINNNKISPHPRAHLWIVFDN